MKQVTLFDFDTFKMPHHFTLKKREKKKENACQSLEKDALPMLCLQNKVIIGLNFIIVIILHDGD